MYEETRLAPRRRLADVQRNPPSASKALGGFAKKTTKRLEGAWRMLLADD